MIAEVLDFGRLFVWLVYVLLALAALPWMVYAVAWLLGRAWYSGRMSAIHHAFHSTRRDKWSKRKQDSGTKNGPRMT